MAMKTFKSQYCPLPVSFSISASQMKEPYLCHSWRFCKLKLNPNQLFNTHTACTLFPS